MPKQKWNNIILAAAKNGDIKKLKKAIKMGADINSEDEYGNTAVMWAAKKNNIACLAELIHLGADVNIKSAKNDTPIIAAASVGNALAIKILIEAKADINSENIDKLSPLKAATQAGHKRCVEVLLEAGADINTLPSNIQNRYKASPSPIANKATKAKYQMVNEYIVVKYEGKIKNLGELRRIFDFNAKTITDVINETTGSTKRFIEFQQNKYEIMSAYNWLKKKNPKLPHPFNGSVKKRIIKK